MIWFFKRVNNFPAYIICSDGTLYSTHYVSGCRIMKSHKGRQGYERYSLRKNGDKRKLRSVRGLVLEHFKRRREQIQELINGEDCPF